MKRPPPPLLLQEEECDVDYFSTLPAELLDSICAFQAEDDYAESAIPVMLRVLHSSAIISLLSRTHREWWLTHTLLETHTVKLIKQSIAEHDSSWWSCKVICGAAEKCLFLRHCIKKVFLNDGMARFTLLYPAFYQWAILVHKSHATLPSKWLRKLYKRDPTAPCLFELMLAFYRNLSAFSLTLGPDPRVEIGPVQEGDDYIQMRVYRREDSSSSSSSGQSRDYTVFLRDRKTQIDVRGLIPLTLNPPNNGTLPVYAIRPIEYATECAHRIAQHVTASHRLREALSACSAAYEKYKPVKK